MAVRVRLRCQFCDAKPDPEAQRRLERGLRERRRDPRHPWKMPPYATSRRSTDTERAVALGGLSSMPKWGLPS